MVQELKSTREILNVVTRFIRIMELKGFTTHDAAICLDTCRDLIGTSERLRNNIYSIRPGWSANDNHDNKTEVENDTPTEAS